MFRTRALKNFWTIFDKMLNAYESPITILIQPYKGLSVRFGGIGDEFFPAEKSASHFIILCLYIVKESIQLSEFNLLSFRFKK